MNKYEVGTLIEDMGNIGVVSRVFQKSEHPTAPWAINCRPNYEIRYSTGNVVVMSFNTLDRLISKGQVKILSKTEENT